MENKKTIWIINQYASHLETRHLELSKVFAEHGYQVVVITSSFHHGEREYLYPDEYHTVERMPNVHYIYLHSRPAYKDNGGKRVLNFFDFAWLTLKYESRIARDFGAPKYIIGSSLHPMVWEASNKIAKKYNAKWVAEFRDFWPLQLTDIMGLPKWHPMVIFFGIIEKRAYQHSDAIVPTMPYADKYICDQLGFPRKKVHWMPNGIDTKRVDENLIDDSIILDKDLADYLSNHWCCVFCGSLNKSENVPYIVSSFEYLKDHKDIYLAIIGSGHYDSEIQAKIDELSLNENVRMFPSIPYNHIPKMLELSYCCVAAISDYPLYQYGLSMRKLNDYLYSGKPTIIETGFDNPVKEAGGFSISFNDPKRYAETILKVKNLSQDQLEELAASEKKLIKEKYDSKIIGENYIKLLESL